MLTTTDVITNPEDFNIDKKILSVNCPKYDIPIPPTPLIGTLKFVASKTIQELIDKNLITYNESNSNVNPYDSSNKIRDDFDGWVFPNG